MCSYITYANCANTSTTTPSSAYASSLQFTQTHARVADEAPFLKLYTLALSECVYECQIRTECRAVNYWRLRQMCELLAKDTPDQDLSRDKKERPCSYIRMSDVKESPALGVSSICPSCGSNEVCDVETGLCVIRECRPHVHPNASIEGNVLHVGSRIRITCNQWYVPTSYATCLSNGTWSPIVPCEYQFDCGLPPYFENAYPSSYKYEGTSTQDNLVVIYRCDWGYAAPLDDSDMTLDCDRNISDPSNFTWAQPEFTCIRNCSEPLEGANVTANASLAGSGTLEGTIRTYTCDPGLVPYGNFTTTCQSSGNWTDVNFACVQERCPVGWSVFEGICYFLNESVIISGNESNFVTYCHDNVDPNSYMLHVETAEKQALVEQMLQNSTAAGWCLGLHNPALDNNWVWSGSGAALSYSNWVSEVKHGTASDWCLGLHNPALDNNWTWSRTGAAVSYTNWDQGGNDGVLYARMITSGNKYKWRDTDRRSCTPVCEIPKTLSNPDN